LMPIAVNNLAMPVKMKQCPSNSCDRRNLFPSRRDDDSLSCSSPLHGVGGIIDRVGALPSLAMDNAAAAAGSAAAPAFSAAAASGGGL
jgi:hypothetical protein